MIGQNVNSVFHGVFIKSKTRMMVGIGYSLFLIPSSYQEIIVRCLLLESRKVLTAILFLFKLFFGFVITLLIRTTKKEHPKAEIASAFGTPSFL
jgi:hypothetical protein